MDLIMLSVFFVSYLLIALEHPLKVEKASMALLAGVASWTIFIVMGQNSHWHEELNHHLVSIAEIIIFLMGAMTMVVVIDRHQGFSILTDLIKATDKRLYLAILGFLTFFLSSFLDNLATTIIMISVMLKVISGSRDRVVFTGLLVIAANSGGAFSPIGDITTTMLWIGGQVTPEKVIPGVFLPSLLSFLVPLGLALPLVKGKLEPSGSPTPDQEGHMVPQWQRNLVAGLGGGLILLIPVFKIVTGLPPFMGVLGALAILWIVTEVMQANSKEGRRIHLTVTKSLGEIDMTSVLFFTGILLSVAALETAGILGQVAAQIQTVLPDPILIGPLLGFISAVFDNVPLVAATMKMYPLADFPPDSIFWHLLSYSAGTGGSLLIIGSAAGVTAMGLTKIRFGQYAKTIAPLALAGYVAGLVCFYVQTLF